MSEPRDPRIGDRFVCNLAGEKALCEVLYQVLEGEGRGQFCCRIVRGSLVDVAGVRCGAGKCANFPGDRVRTAVARYREKGEEENGCGGRI